MLRYEMIEGNAEVISIMANDGWALSSTFANPNPEPYFFALMFIDHPHANEYDTEALFDKAYRGWDFPKWERTNNNQKRKQKYNSSPF